MNNNKLENCDIEDSRLITWRFLLNLSLEENTLIIADSYNPNLISLSRYVNTLTICCNNPKVLSKYNLKTASLGLLNVVLIEHEEILHKVDPKTVNVFICYSKEKNNKKLLNHVNSLFFVFGSEGNCKQFLYNVKNPFVVTGKKTNRLYSIIKLLAGFVKIKAFENRNLNLMKSCGGLDCKVIYFTVGPVGEGTCIYGNYYICHKYYNNNFTSFVGNNFLKKIVYNIIVFIGFYKILSEEFLYLVRK